MAPNPFVKAAPASGSISWEDLKGRLLLVEPLEVLADPIATTNGEQTGKGTITAMEINPAVDASMFAKPPAK